MFKEYNPYVNLLYFIIIIGISIFYINPIIIFLTFISISIYYTMINDKKNYFKLIKNYLPVMTLIVIINLFVNHQGTTVLFFIKNNPYTKESLLYGIFSAIMLFNVFMEFNIFNKIMDSEKIYALLGKLSPTVSLIFSFVLRFIPLYKDKFKEIKEANLHIFKNNFMGKISYYSTCLSAFTSYVLENGIDTADSFVSRGYGLSKRTTFTPIKFKKSDNILLLIEIIFSSLIIYFVYMGKYSFYFFPTISNFNINTISILSYVTLFIFISIPILIDLKEELFWHIYRQKI